jgi:hypothetical protein
MKKWMYLIFPGAMLGIFLVFFFSHQKEAEEREHARMVKVEEEARKKEAEKKAAEEKLRQEAMQKQQEREREEAEKERARREKQAALDKEVTDAIATNQALGEAAQKKINAAELELSQLHKDKDRLSRETFTLWQQVESLKVDRQTAEMREQRLTEMIARKASESAMAQLPPPPPIAPTR